MGSNKKKSSFMHDVLDTVRTLATVGQIELNKFASAEELPPIKVIEEVFKTSVPVAPERLSNGICKIHSIPLDNRGKCLQKGCKYA